MAKDDEKKRGPAAKKAAAKKSGGAKKAVAKKSGAAKKGTAKKAAANDSGSSAGSRSPERKAATKGRGQKSAARSKRTTTRKLKVSHATLRKPAPESARRHLTGRAPHSLPARPGRVDRRAGALGTLMIIGGAEDKKHEKLILRALAQRVGPTGKLVVCTAASSVAEDVWGDYEPLFRALGLHHVHHLHVESREDARNPAKVRVLDDADAVFITGGDQLKLTSQLGDSPIYERIRDIYESGGTIAGTSAGASVVCETMMVSGTASETHTIASELRMAPGFGLIPGVIIDQHFAQRGRIGRLIAAVAQNPRILGVGIDEDTAIVCDRSQCFSVIGTGGVTVVDAAGVSYSNIGMEEKDRTLSVFGIRLHQLSMGDEFSLATRCPVAHPAEEIEDAILERTG